MSRSFDATQAAGASAEDFRRAVLPEFWALVPDHLEYSNSNLLENRPIRIWRAMCFFYSVKAIRCSEHSC
jgi:hypothetical protein